MGKSYLPELFPSQNLDQYLLIYGYQSPSNSKNLKNVDAHLFDTLEYVHILNLNNMRLITYFGADLVAKFGTRAHS